MVKDIFIYIIKMEIEKIFSNPVNMTYFLTFLVLSGTTIITLLLVTSGDLSDDKNKGEYYIKNALVSETSVNIIASITYYYLLGLLQNNYDFVTPIRYLDWVITTPLLLLSFVLYTTYKHNHKNPDATDKDLDLGPLLLIIGFNFGMLLFGYLGETKRVNKYTGLGVGFVFFALLFWYLYEHYVDGYDSSLTVYIAFTTVWALYGVAYLLKPGAKNIAYNILDMISKGGFGVLLWLTVIQDK